MQIFDLQMEDTMLDDLEETAIEFKNSYTKIQ